MTQTQGVDLNEDLNEEVKEAVNRLESELESEYKGRMDQVDRRVIDEHIEKVLEELFSFKTRGEDKKMTIETLLKAEVLDRILENERENRGVTVIEKKDHTTPILILLAGALLVANYINTPVSGKLGKRKSRRRRNKKKKGTKRRRSRKN
jgi:hypothetical protein